MSVRVQIPQPVTEGRQTMRIAACGLSCTAVLVAVCWAISLDLSAYGQPPARPQAQPVLPSRLPVAAAGDLMAFSSETTTGPSQVMLIDAKTRVMCVYHVDRTTGEIELKSVRNFHWDLLLEEFNGVQPLPSEIRALMERK